MVELEFGTGHVSRFDRTPNRPALIFLGHWFNFESGNGAEKVFWRDFEYFL
jgi:hypothetical protein